MSDFCWESEPLELEHQGSSSSMEDSLFVSALVAVTKRCKKFLSVGKRSYADAVRVGLGDNPMTIPNHRVLKNGSLPATRVTRMTLNNCRQHNDVPQCPCLQQNRGQ
jgi:hypothetical protein